MSVRKVLLIARLSLRRLLARPIDLFFVIALPLLIILVIGFSVFGSVDRGYKVGIVDEGAGPRGQALIAAIERSPAVDPVVFARLADSTSVRVGDQVLVVGAPYGLAYSLSVGYVSARWPPNSVYPAFPLAEFFQTDATINTGNSGGPLFNMAGDVIGIVSHNISKGGGSQGLGFVVTINTAKQLLLVRKSFWSGLEGEILSPELADLLNLPPGAGGYLIKSVAKGSPGDRVGLRGGTKLATIDGRQIALGGDILLKVEGVSAGSLADLVKIRSLLAGLKPGTAFKATILRAGRVLEVTGRIGEAD